MTEVEAQRLVACLVTVFPNTMSRLSSEQQGFTEAVYRRLLLDLDYATANAAIARLLATSRFMPTIAEIRESAMALTIGEQPAGGEAWGKVLGAISRYGIYRTPGKDFHFDDATTARCVTAIGWTNLCNSENQVADRARFIDLFDTLASTVRREQLTEPLPAVQKFREIQAAREDRRGSVGLNSAIDYALQLVQESEQ